MRNLPNLFMSVILLSSSAVYAKVYKKIQVHGASTLGENSVIFYSKLVPGKNITNSNIRQAIINLHNSGLYEAISIQEKQDSLIINVT